MIDVDSLTIVHSILEKHVRSRKVRQANEPLFEAVAGNMFDSLDQSSSPLIEARATSISSGLRLERLLDEPQPKDELSERLERARNRTAALRAWLEALP